jgi:hypothetical protein
VKLKLETKPSERASALWQDSEPFVENKQGILIHRPRSVTLYNTLRYPHIAVHYYCGGSVTDSKGKLKFFTEPDEDMMLCTYCEARAVMAGLPAASEIIGKHFHTGKLKAVRNCGH